MEIRELLIGLANSGNRRGAGVPAAASALPE
jgi:hypothetical protein